MFTFFSETFAPFFAVIGGAMVAGRLGLPQGLGFEHALMFEALAVTLVVAAVSLVGYGLVGVVREERRSVAARCDSDVRTQLARRMGCEL